MIMIIIMTRVLIIIIGKLVDEDVIIDIIININIIISIITIIKIIMIIMMILREASAWEAGRRLPPRLWHLPRLACYGTSALHGLKVR